MTDDRQCVLGLGADTFDIDEPVHVACSCGKSNCTAPAPAGFDGLMYDPSGAMGRVKTVYVDLGPGHPNCYDDCSHTFLFKAKDVSLRRGDE